MQKGEGCGEPCCPLAQVHPMKNINSITVQECKMVYGQDGRDGGCTMDRMARMQAVLWTGWLEGCSTGRLARMKEAMQADGCHLPGALELLRRHRAGLAGFNCVKTLIDFFFFV